MPYLKNSKPVLWVLDPWETLDHKNDTSLRLMEEGLTLSVPQYYTFTNQITLKNQKCVLGAHVFKDRSVLPMNHTIQEFEPDQFSQIHYRIDPPLDSHYFHPLQILHLHSKKAKIYNSPDVLYSWNEKWIGQRWNQLPTLVTNQSHIAEAFLKKERLTACILKPLDEAQSKKILLWDKKSNDSFTSTFLQCSENQKNHILVQKYSEKITTEGEIRLWFCFGKLLGGMRKKPLSGSSLVLIDQGSEVLPLGKIPQKVKKLIPSISKFLKSHQVAMCALDMIDAQVTDFNISSPGLLQKMEELDGKNYASMIWKKLI